MKRILALLLTTGLLLLAGCGGTPSGAPASTQTQPQTQAQTQAPGPSAPAAKEPVRGGTALMVIENDPRGIDPALAGDGPTLRTTEVMFSNLLRYEGENRDKIVGNLAESWDWSSDAKSVTFKLREGLTFSDGSPLTAEDVAHSITRVLDPATKAPYQGAFRVIEGAADFIDGKADRVAGIEVLNPREVKFTLSRPAPYFLHIIALPSAGIMSKKAGVSEDPKQFVGSGPFVLDKWSRGQELVVKRNPNYWRKGLPYLDQITFKIGVQPATQTLMFEKGELHNVSPVPPGDFLKVMADEKLKASYLEQPGVMMYYLGMNPGIQPFDKKEVRQAFNYAVNKERLVQITNGRAAPMTSLIPPWIAGHDFNSKQPYPHDPDKAKALLAQAGYPNGFEIDLLVPNYREQPLIAQAVQSDLGKVGIKVNIKTEALTVVRTAIRKGDVPFFAMNWGTDFPDPQNVLSTLLHSAQAGRMNLAYYRNSDVDALLDKADSVLDPKERVRYYHEAEKQIFADAPWVFEVYGKSDSLSSPKLKGDVPKGTFIFPPGMRNFDEVWLDQ